jgi:hypothetical protein
MLIVSPSVTRGTLAVDRQGGGYDTADPERVGRHLAVPWRCGIGDRRRVAEQRVQAGPAADRALIGTIGDDAVELDWRYAEVAIERWEG